MVVVAARPGKGFAVYCLHEGHSGAVEMLAQGKRVVLHSAEQAFVQHQAADNGNACFEPVAMRNLRREDLDEGKLYLSEFSIPSAIAYFKVQQELKASNKAKQLAAILKNAAVMHTAFAHKGAYKLPD